MKIIREVSLDASKNFPDDFLEGEDDVKEMLNKTRPFFQNSEKYGLYTRLLDGYKKVQLDDPLACVVCDQFVWPGEYSLVEPDKIPEIFFKVLAPRYMSLTPNSRQQYNIVDKLSAEMTAETKEKISHLILSPRGGVF